MNLELKGKRALISGSSSGIGAGIASVLAQEGATVVIHGRDAGRTRQVAEDIKKSGGSALSVLGDIATEDGCTQIGAAVMKELGGIDILVNNAGGRSPRLIENGAPVVDMKWSEWLVTMEMNLGGAVRLIQQFVPGMKERKWGRVVNIASAAATQPEANLAEYQAAKVGMVSLTNALARELAHTGITVNTVSPGAILTPAVVTAFTATARLMGWENKWETIEHNFIHQLIPIYADHFGQPEDIGRVVALLASPLSSYMTGANYRVDGGQCRSIN